MSNRIIAIVPVRSGSKGLRGKNMRLLDGVPLYLIAVNQAIRTVGKVVLSTDIREINHLDLPRGCIYYKRPEALAKDETNIEDVIHDIIEKLDLKDETIVLLQATSPLRTDSDIKKAIQLFNSDEFSMVLSTTKRDSAINMERSKTTFSIKRREYCFLNRQQLPSVYAPNGAIYIFKADQFKRNGSLATRLVLIACQKSVHRISTMKMISLV